MVPPTATTVRSYIVVGADGADVHSGPGTDYARMGYLDPGAEAEVTGYHSDWWQIEYDGASCWVFGGRVFAFNTDNIPQVEPPPAPTAAPPTATSPPTPTAAPPTATIPPAPTATLAQVTDTPQPTATTTPPGDLAPGVWRCPSSTEGAAYVGSTQSDEFHYYFTSRKRGIATHHPEVTADVEALSPTWRYDWFPDTPVYHGVESVPMIYSPPVLHQLLSGETTLGGNSPYILGYNEPDRPDQANVPPEVAVLPWLFLERTYPDHLLVSPAPSHERPEWLAEFYAAFVAGTGRAPRFEALAIHCYYVNTTSGCKQVFEQVLTYADEWDIPGGVWVTEFGPACSAQGFDATTAELESRELIQWLEAQPGIARYAWFPTRLDGTEYWKPNLEDWAVLVDEQGLTRWGDLYIGCQHANKISAENRICFASREAAVNYGYVPCGGCKP